MFEDSLKFKGLRNQMVEKLQAKGIFDKKVLQAMRTIPRHFFFDSAFSHHAYQDKPFSIGLGQTISSPYTVAFQSSLLNVEKDMKVLEIGTGSGYQAAVLSALGAKLWSLEYFEALHKKAKLMLDLLALPAKLLCKDGSIGYMEQAPYDRILFTCAVQKIDKQMLNQLKIGGKLVAPLGDNQSQTMTCIIRLSETDFEQQSFEQFRFVPLLGEKGIKTEK